MQRNAVIKVFISELQEKNNIFQNFLASNNLSYFLQQVLNTVSEKFASSQTWKMSLKSSEIVIPSHKPDI